jgi:outer membrane protein assembly factor BamB
MSVRKQLFILVSLCCVLPACTQVDDFMLGKDNTPKPAALEKVTPKMNLVENWSIPVGKSKNSSPLLKLKPVVKGNTIYTATSSGTIEALDKSSGNVVWSKQLKDDVISGPSVADGYLAVGTNSSSVIVLKQEDGDELWQAKISGDSLSKPVISKGKLIVKTVNGNLYGFNVKTGEKLWVVDHGSPSLILKASASPIIMDKLALVGFSDGKLDAVDVQTGTLVWQRSIAYPSGSSDVERLVDIDADPIVRGDTIYLASYQGYVGALSMSDGQFKWHKPASTYRNLAIDSETLYMTDSDDVVWAIDRQSGQIKWKQEAFKARSLTEPVIMGGNLFLGDKTGYLHVLSTLNGEVLARSQLSGAITTAPTVSGNNIYVMTSNGKLNRLSVS